MKKKIILASFAALSAVVALPLLSAFEAHIINVTAQIENALSVDTHSLTFGTVFPQEKLDRFFDISLSQSFEDEQKADDVNYIIRQKPKCGWTTDEGEILVGETQSGHVDDEGRFSCPSPTVDTPPIIGAVWGQLPLLCRYLSKHEMTHDHMINPDGTQTLDNDDSLNAFHEIGSMTTGTWVWTDVKGRLAKSENDYLDTWDLDLKVPCFEGHCAQDWDNFVHTANPNSNVNPNSFIQPITNEHKVFGCDIWVEVTGVSRLN